MTFLWFLFGLAIGLAFLGWYHLHLTRKLKRLIYSLQPDVLRWPLSSTSRLMRAIAAHVTSHEALTTDLETWRQLCHAAPIGVLQVDDENQLLWCNDQAGQLLSIQPPHLANRRLLLELVRSYELDQLIEQTRILQKSCQSNWTFHPVCADPSQLSRQLSRPLRAHSILLGDGCVGVFLESRQETVLLAQQRDRWISDVAHELKTPLTSVRLVAETLQMRLEPPLRDWIDRLLNETIRLSSLVQDLLDLSQLEANPNPNLKLKTVDVTKLIQSAWFSLELLARKKQLQLDYVGPDRLLMQLDESRMHRVLLNLFDNAIKYSPSQQAVRVRVSLVTDNSQTQEQLVQVEIIDAGPGFPTDALPYVFDRFYRADPSRSRSNASLEVSRVYSAGKSNLAVSNTFADDTQAASETPAVPTSSGSGLGLAIVRQIVEAHQGWVQANNHPETQGGWLQVFLPWQSVDDTAT
ncbi:PAS domain-containing sensor histidine kinase [Stenomitos frigidus]|uniref:histidine kinase n=1 Tax=Stenomitos frigidus ULC18 TaxID=2107698 RepID=A0A2T1E315_9CYAN|nr:PAS domain-containing sensor histidine kinase [Stenomitos frigidus]PSB27143.1 PAS domain-containing sensor histidine kinase [Stenomitos frigidus ULC18]